MTQETTAVFEKPKQEMTAQQKENAETQLAVYMAQIDDMRERQIKGLGKTIAKVKTEWNMGFSYTLGDETVTITPKNRQLFSIVNIDAVFKAYPEKEAEMLIQDKLLGRIRRNAKAFLRRK